MLPADGRMRVAAMRDAFKLTRSEITILERTIYARLAGLEMLGCSRNEISVERLNEIAKMLAQWRVETYELVASDDC